MPEILIKFSGVLVNTLTVLIGSGIGLSIVSRLLQLHSASYGVESTEGVGTTFWFELDFVEKIKYEE